MGKIISIIPWRKIRTTLSGSVTLFLVIYVVIRVKQFSTTVPQVTKFIDWHDYSQIKKEALRTGPGEQGLPLNFNDDGKDYFSKTGFHLGVSNQISLERAVPDIRHPECKSKKYPAKLPTVAVIVPYHNEPISTLFRTVYSVINRSPPSLINEIILVDDASNLVPREEIEAFIKSHQLDSKVRIVYLKKRAGLISARTAGAKAASSTSEVYIFLDCHTEANVNWLPPLLEPIAANYRTSVCPFIDVIDHTNFRYAAQDEGARGAFDWSFHYKRLPLLPEDLKNPTKPFKNPVMAGGLFAISAKFFWELGGYDEGLQIWGGEQYELSFKIWMCGGQLLDAPCSRVGHVYRKFAPFSSGGISNYLFKNYQRVLDVWMDEYAQWAYKRNPHFRSGDPGDISKQLELRERLKCKSFKWFMENVAFDLLKVYPLVDPPNFGEGKIQSVHDPTICVGISSNRLYLAECVASVPKFFYTWRKDIRRTSGESVCWDVSQGGDRAQIDFYPCHNGGGNQMWIYDQQKQILTHGDGSRCLDCDMQTREIFISHCQSGLNTQQWKFEKLNEEQMKKINSI